MMDLFLDVLNTSFAASWVVLAVVLARLLLKKAPRWMVCALWALVAARLLIGGGIVAPFSMIPSTEVIPPQSLYDQAPVIHSGVPILDNAINPVYTESLRPMPGNSVNPLQIWTAAFAVLWVAGMAIMALWAVFSWDRVRRQVRESISADGVFLCDRIASPFIFGLFQPKIYLPSGLDDDARAHVIAHERAHLHRRDHWWKPLGFALLTVNWFNPAMWLAYILLCRDIEMACDERVVRSLSMAEKKAYSTSLLSCSINHRHITACPLAFGEVGVKQRVKSVLNYKKPAFWVILVTVVLTVVLAASLLTSPEGESEPAELRWGGNLYIQSGEPVDFVPDKQQSTGVLNTIVEDPTAHPTQNAQAVRLDRGYIGQPLVQVGYALYLQEPDGSGWLPFRMLTGAEALGDSIAEDTWYLLTLHQSGLYGNEELTGASADALATVLRELTARQMTPGPMLDWQQYADDSDARITIQPEQPGCSFELFRTAQYGWVCFCRDLESGDSDWYFDGSSLDRFLLPYEAELKGTGSSFPRSPDASLSLEFHTVDKHGLQLRAGIPCLEQGDSHIHWEWEPLEGVVGFRCRPIGRKAWMDVRFYDTEDTLYYIYSHEEPLTLASGATGTLYHSGNPSRWDMIDLNTTQGQLQITSSSMDAASDWTENDYRMGLAIIGSISASRNGASLFDAPPSEMEEPNLGIQLTVEDVTPTGLTLVCAQDGTLWHEILTGSYWAIQEYRDGVWVDLLPEDTTWTSEAYPVPIGGTRSFSLNWEQTIGDLGPGRYRIAKPYSGYAKTGLHQSAKEAVSQTCYAEFQLNPLGITLWAEDVTCRGLRLFCTQAGGSEGLEEITTSPGWTLERWEDDKWVRIMTNEITLSKRRLQVPMGGTTAWNIGFEQATGLLQDGRYRIGKTFYGLPGPDDMKSTTQVIGQTCYAVFEVNPLGITLEAEDITPGGATLVCTQDATPWDRIITSSDWTLEQWTVDGWVSVLPEDTIWSAIAIQVNQGCTTSWNLNWSLVAGDLAPGRYRVGKTFLGTSQPSAETDMVGESLQQTCYAEFIIV